MILIPLTDSIARTQLAAIRLIATDMDGTLTIAGKFSVTLLQALQDLAAVQLPVLIVTGRSAGWVSSVVNYLPVWGAIAENGGLVYPAHAPMQLLSSFPDPTQHRQQLAEVFDQLQAKFPQLQESADNRFRITDWTFDVQGLSIAEVQHLSTLCHSWGWGFTYSTVQCHIKPLLQDKAVGLQQVLQQHFPDLTPAQVLTVGDSPNDASLFDPAWFPHSIGVANVQHYRDQLPYLPRYITAQAEGDGFAELAQTLITKHNQTVQVKS